MIPLPLFRDQIVMPALAAVQCFSITAERLVIGTALVESGLVAVRQKGGGPALGYFQMEPATHDDLWQSFLSGKGRGHLRDGLALLSSAPGKSSELETNPFYAAAMCRILYLRPKESLPRHNDLEGFAHYWKRFYNTPAGKGTVDGFMQKAAPVMNL